MVLQDSFTFHERAIELLIAIKYFDDLEKGQLKSLANFRREENHEMIKWYKHKADVSRASKNRMKKLYNEHMIKIV